MMSAGVKSPWHVMLRVGKAANIVNYFSNSSGFSCIRRAKVSFLLYLDKYSCVDRGRREDRCNRNPGEYTFSAAINLQPKSRGFVKQFQSRQVILPELFLYILLSHDKITHIDKLEFDEVKLWNISLQNIGITMSKKYCLFTKVLDG